MTTTATTKTRKSAVKTPRSKTSPKAVAKYTRKATFNVVEVKGKQVLSAVNKPAKRVVKSLGHRTVVSPAELKSSVGKGSYSFWQYSVINDSTSLVPVKF